MVMNRRRCAAARFPRKEMLQAVINVMPRVVGPCRNADRQRQDQYQRHAHYPKLFPIKIHLEYLSSICHPALTRKSISIGDRTSFSLDVRHFFRSAAYIARKGNLQLLTKPVEASLLPIRRYADTLPHGGPFLSQQNTCYFGDRTLGPLDSVQELCQPNRSLCQLMSCKDTILLLVVAR